MPTNGRYQGFVATGALLATLLGCLLWVSILIGPWRLVDGMLDARSHLDRARKALESGALKEARHSTLAAIAATEKARAGLDAGGPLLDVARMVPRIDGLVGELPHLVRAAEHSADAALGTLVVAQNSLRGKGAVIIKDPDDPKGSIIQLERVEEIAGTITDVRRSVSLVAQELRAVDLDALPKRLRNDVTDGIVQAVDADEVLADAETGFALLPELLGGNGSRRYLIAMQNSAELRGTGGAILQFATLEIDNGNPTIGKKDRVSSTVYDIDRDREQLSILLPDDAWYVAGVGDAQRFGNANWSPDWPLSARLTIEYGKASAARFPGITFPEPDGMLVVDPIAMQHLLPGVGPYRTEQSRNRITGGRVVHFLLNKAYGSFPNTGHRRAVLRQVVDGFYEGLLNPAHPTLLIEGFGKTLAQKHMQIWLADPAEQAFIERMEWDGAMRPAIDADYALIVEQNVGGNKLDYFAHQTDTIEVSFDGTDALVSNSTLISNDVFLPQPRYALGDSGPLHRPMMNFYMHENAVVSGWDVPPRCPSSTFAESTCRLDTPDPAIWSGEQPATHSELGKKVLSATLQIPPGQEGSLGFDYRVPGAVRNSDGRNVYRLVVQQQPKVRPQTLVVTIQLPAGATAVRAPGFERRGDVLSLEIPLKSDVVLEVSWQD